MNNLENYINKLDTKYFRLNEPLSKHSQVRIGGPADIWYEAKSTEDFIHTIKLAKEYEVPITVLGGGSNTLISDKGIRGIVIRNMSKNIIIDGKNELAGNLDYNSFENTQARWQSDNLGGTFRGIEFKDLDYDESIFKRIKVNMDSGVELPFAINYLVYNGITGLQWYAKIPGTIGGAVFNNIHGGTHFFEEIISSVRVIDPKGNIKVLDKKDLGVDYDKSRFHDSGEIIIDAQFSLYEGDAEKAKYVTQEWIKRKASQPANSLGSVFANISNELKVKLGFPTTSTGYIIEHVLKMTGFRIGDAAICPTSHNFITNEGNAKASDYLAVIREIQKRAKEQIGIDLIPEIFFIGEFD